MLRRYSLALALLALTASCQSSPRVSPAPATATFVEALAKSGITAGCGGGNYCPHAPLTPGQMAVFLSKALGLHFAP